MGVRAPRMEVLGGLLKPLVRFLLRGNHSYQDFLNVAKEVFVQVAVEELSKSTKKLNSSRISVLTGLNRKDVAHYYKSGRMPPRKGAPLISRVLNRWEQDPRFHSNSGRQRALSWEGESSEFKELVRCVSTDVNPATVLFELERMGLVKKRGRLVRPSSQVPRFHQDPRKGLEFLRLDNESLFTAIEENIFNRQEIANLHIRTEYDNVLKSAIPKIRAWLLEEGAAFHKRARDFISIFDKDLNPGLDGESQGRVSLIAFSCTEPQNSAPNDGGKMEESLNKNS
ncbi:MAG: hypothetical protein DCC75_05625 [Proteobacteria bacterium]|nr:MAG: hypothetical protein DCC75_05625 [Pseudomonadota bacterium]